MLSNEYSGGDVKHKKQRSKVGLSNMITGRGESETFRNPNGASHMIIEEVDEVRRSNEKEMF
jgi:hypothetical protein